MFMRVTRINIRIFIFTAMLHYSVYEFIQKLRLSAQQAQANLLVLAMFKCIWIKYKYADEAELGLLRGFTPTLQTGNRNQLLWEVERRIGETAGNCYLVIQQQRFSWTVCQVPVGARINDREVKKGFRNLVPFLEDGLPWKIRTTTILQLEFD